MAEVTLLMSSVDYEGSTVLAVFAKESEADKALSSINEWISNKPDNNGEEDYWEVIRDYNKTFPFKEEYYADEYFKVKHELR